VEGYSKEALDPCLDIPLVGHVDCPQVVQLASMVSSLAVAGSAVELRDPVWAADWHRSGCAEQLPRSGHFVLVNW
jgi:hypothetical protein